MACATRTLLTGLLAVLTGCGGGGGSGPPAIFAPFQPASGVLAQPDFVSMQINQGQPGTHANGVRFPEGIALTPTHLLVTDSGNHRILGFTHPPIVDDPSAAFVIGQPNFQANVPTLGNGLNCPQGVAYAGGRLFVADTDNNRVLIWNQLPTMGEAADVVLGQPDLHTGLEGGGPSGLDGPKSVWFAGGKLFVADSDNRRVLIWNSQPATNGQAADVVLGQPNFTSDAAAVTAAGMDYPIGIWSDGTRLVVVDTGNHRVLIWQTIPSTSGAPADTVVGQSDFMSFESGAGPDAMATPIHVASDGVRLFVSELHNQRVLAYNTIPTTNDRSASAVLGQSDFTHVAPNDDDQDDMQDATPTARTLMAPTGLAWRDGKLYVAQATNHRVTVFDVP